MHAVALDLSKAYNKINIKILIDKLTATNLPAPITKIIAYMLSNTYVNVRYNGCIGN